MPQSTAPEYDLREHLSAGRESWRPQRPPTAINPQIKRIVLITAGVLSFGAFCGFVTSALVRHSHVVPVIEADPRPLRVKPADPGGMQFAGSDELSSDDGSGTADVVMPPPEDPKVDALHQQIQAAHPASAPQLVPPPPPAVVASVPPPPPIAAPSVPTAPPPPVAGASPEPRPAPLAAAPPPLPSGFVEQLSSKTQVQLAAMTTQDGAVAEWRRLAKRMPELLGARRPAIMRTERDGKTFYRLRVGGFTDSLAADLFCTHVRLQGGVCAVATF